MSLIKGLLIICLLNLCACNSVFFHPTKEALISPDQIGIKYEVIKIKDGRGPVLYGWFLPANGEALGTILHLHGNAENISTHFASIYWLPSRSYNVLTVDYRGYGNSEGQASMQGLHEDALRSLDYMTSQLAHANKPFILYGQSLGASIALRSAALAEAKPLISAVVAESPFSSYRKIAREKLADFWITYLLRYPLAATISSDYDPIKVIDKISPTPLLFIHSKTDQVVPYHHSQDLFDKAEQPKQLWSIEQAAHVQIFNDSTNRQKLIEFLKTIQR